MPLGKKIVKQGRSWVDVGPTVPPGINLHVGKKFGRTGSHCATRKENYEAGKKLG